MQRLAWCVLGAGLLVAGCRGRASPSAPPSPDASVAPRVEPTQEERDGRRRSRDPLVFVDGRPVAVIRFREMPPGLQPVVVSYGPKKVVRFSVHAYLRALGVDMAHLKEVHLHGGRAHASVIPAAVLEAHQGDLLFQLSQQVAGKPMMSWPEEPIPGVGRLDMLSDISVFVERVPPRFDEARGIYLMPGGGPSGTDIPYVPDRDIGGTRVYVDGRLKAFLRRGSQEERETVTPLRGALAATGVDLSAARVMEILNDDDVAARIPVAELPALGTSFPAHNQGRMRLHRPVDGGTAELRVSAIHFWSREDAHAGVPLSDELRNQPHIRPLLEGAP